MHMYPKFHNEIRGLFADYLSRTPTPKEADPMVCDIGRLHPALLRDALKEATAGRTASSDTRSSLLTIYARKTKEMAAVYPLMFAVENAIRARMAEECFSIFGIDAWWAPVRTALVKGNPGQSVRDINGVALTNFLARNIASIIFQVDGDRFQHPKTHLMTCGSEFLSASTFNKLRFMVSDNWSEFGRLFSGRSGGPRMMTKKEFLSYTTTISEVRNDLYHHNPISERQKCVEACEIIADHLSCHLGAFDEKLRTTVYHRPSFSVAVQDTHHVEAD